MSTIQRVSKQASPDGTAYEIVGPEDAPCIVLIHGLGLSRSLWNDHKSAFASDYRVLSYDLYGHGDSSPPPETASLQVYSEQLAGLLRHLQIEQAIVVGFSIGGMINRRFALDHADMVSTMVIMNSPHDRGVEAQRMVEQRAMTVRDQGVMATMADALTRWFTPTALMKRPELAENVKDWRQQVDPESYAQAAWVLANGVVELINPSPKLAVPSLVLTCENDTGSTPAMSKAIASENPNAELLIIPTLQHLGLMEDPDAFTIPILEFLGRIRT